MLSRALPLAQLVQERSHFLFGPRQTGKSTLLRQALPEGVYYNLLEANTYREVVARPEVVRERLTPGVRMVVIDEIQRFPELLNEVQLMLDRDSKLRFVLTGSSARGLRQGGVNLLGGRARTAHLHPLTWSETGSSYWKQRLAVGSLPGILLSSSPWEDLGAYVGTYLQEEIRAEGFVRSMEVFSRFLETAALLNTQLVNFTSIGSDSGIPPRTVREYFQLLEDTLVGHMLPPYQKTRKRKPVATSKFYLFDLGVANFLMQRPRIEPGSPEFGAVLEHQIYLELKAYLSYRRLGLPLTFWRSQSKLEVDFVVGNSMAVEVKAASRVQDRDLAGLRALAEEVKLKHKLVVCQERHPRRLDDGVEIVPVHTFLDKLWADGYALG